MVPSLTTFRTLLTRVLMMLIFAMGMAVNAHADALDDASALLVSKSFDDKSKAIHLLADQQHDRTREILTLLMDSQLYYHRKDDILYIIPNHDTGAVATDLSGNTVTIERKRDFKKVTINNNLRREISKVLAGLSLNAKDAGERESAVRDLLNDLSPDTVALLKERFVQEGNRTVKAVISVALAINDLKSDDESMVLQAMDTVGGSLEPSVKNALNELTSHPTPAISTKAKALVAQIDDKIQIFSYLETFYFGLSLGSVLVLAGIGLAITFGVMGVINMAHGELIMIGAYTTYVIQQLMPNHIGLSIIVAIPAAFIVSGLVGIAIERGVIRFLYGRPLETLLATFGISLILQQAVRTIFTPLNKSVETPEWMSGLIQINPVFALTESRLYIIIFCLMVFFALLLVLKKTPLGLQVRAVSQNRAMAQAMGVRSNRVDALTFGLGSGVAGVAGVALSQLTNVGPNLGQAYIIDSFMVVVFGGVGNLWGTLVAGLSLGVANKVLEPWAGAVLAKILVLVFIILFIQKRPRGLFPQRGRAAEG
jgi:urea transport system permease protein